MIPLNMINKIMYKQLLILNKIEKIYKYQSGFRKHHPAIQTLIKIVIT